MNRLQSSYLSVGKNEFISDLIAESSPKTHDAALVEGADFEAAGVGFNIAAEDSSMRASNSDDGSITLDGDRLQSGWELLGNLVVDPDILLKKKWLQ